MHKLDTTQAQNHPKMQNICPTSAKNVAASAYGRLTVTVKTLGQRVREARLRKGLNQTQLGAIVGLDKQSIGNLETGKTTGVKEFEVAKKLSEFSGIPVAKLVAKPAGAADMKLVVEAERTHSDELEELADQLRDDDVDLLHVAQRLDIISRSLKAQARTADPLPLRNAAKKGATPIPPKHRKPGDG